MAASFDSLTHVFFTLTTLLCAVFALDSCYVNGVIGYCYSGYYCCDDGTGYCCTHGYICTGTETCINIIVIVIPVVIVVLIIITIIVIIICNKKKRASRGTVIHPSGGAPQGQQLQVHTSGQQSTYTYGQPAAYPPGYPPGQMTPMGGPPPVVIPGQAAYPPPYPSQSNPLPPEGDPGPPPKY